MNLGKIKEISRVGLQGRQDYPQWVTKYQVSYSTDGEHFISQNQVGDYSHKLNNDGYIISPNFRGSQNIYTDINWKNE